MTRRPTLLAATALTAAAVLSLSACGGGDGDSASNDKIAGAESGGEKRESPSPTASDDGIDRPEIKLPKDVKHVFEGGSTGDKAKDSVLADNEQNLKAIDSAITVGEDSAQAALKFYNKDKALVSAASYIKSFYDDGRSFVGTTRYYQREVSFRAGGAAALTYCADATKTYPMDRKTKKVDRSAPASADDYTFFSEQLKKNADGVWQSVNVTSGPGAKKCM
ncbi:hypothetical protein AB0I94_33115 [Streptomyces sp. NPDC050147]|uniref:hypothetical protein n=1 Tax=Streptomyces sp. NPDC050147 TaxID=3155513 RepID=UPI00342B53F1